MSDKEWQVRSMATEHSDLCIRTLESFVKAQLDLYHPSVRARLVLMHRNYNEGTHNVSTWKLVLEES